ncbi:ATP-binding protein [Streptomyces sp. NBC_01717]|uniref:ATP-binding protein n=1 Tax=Streptomyces sp. NBC_01717 TaxID=2975918 RepID=UPI002E33D2A9|nr:ATP-binding protein [Streptomyces sp. NBC_01717]
MAGRQGDAGVQLCLHTLTSDTRGERPCFLHHRARVRTFVQRAGRPGPPPAAVGPRPGALQDICDDAVNRLGNAPATGDAVLLLARTGVFPADQVASWDLDNQPESVGQARARTRRRLATWGVDDETAYTTELIVSELVTNAIRYGAPPVQLRLIKGRTLTCEVHDSSPSAPHVRHARTVDEGGRGLFISAQLSEDWGVRNTSDTGGKTVWAEQPLPAQPPATETA